MIESKFLYQSMARPYNLRGAQILKRGKEGEKEGGGNGVRDLIYSEHSS